LATTTHKAWASAAMTLALALVARFTGMVDMPATDAVTDAFLTAGGALVAALLIGFLLAGLVLWATVIWPQSMRLERARRALASPQSRQIGPASGDQ